MGMTIFVYAVATAISTVVLAASLLIIEDTKTNSFRTEGQKATWMKCAGIVIAMTVVGFLPFGMLLALIVFFVGAMVLLQKSFLQALLLLIINGLFSLGVMWVIGRILTSAL
jgi:hypothetical protein